MRRPCVVIISAYSGPLLLFLNPRPLDHGAGVGKLEQGKSGSGEEMVSPAWGDGLTSGASMGSELGDDDMLAAQPRGRRPRCRRNLRGHGLAGGGASSRMRWQAAAGPSSMATGSPARVHRVKQYWSFEAAVR